jgi:hypothetical protein
MLVPVLRPLTLGEALDTSFGVYRSLFASLLSISVATQGIPLALGVFVEASGGAMVNPGLQLLAVVLSMLLGAVGTAATTFLVAEAYLGGGLTTQQAFRRATPFIGPLIVASILTVLVIGASATVVMLGMSALSLMVGSLFLAMGVGMVVAVFVSIAVFCALAVTTPAMVLEETRSATAAMGRSLALTRGHRLRIFVALFVVIFLLLIPTIALSGLAIAARRSESGSVVVLGILLLTSLLQMLVYPFIYVLLTVLYYDLRVRKEGFDLEMLATSLQQA